MQPELLILERLLKRETYNRYREHVNSAYIRNNFKDVWTLYQCLDILMQSTSQEQFTLEELEAFVYLSFPAMRLAERESYGHLFGSIRESSVSPEVLDVLLHTAERRERATRLALKAAEFANGTGSYEDLRDHVSNAFEETSVPLEKPRFVTSDLATLYNTQVATPGLRWRLGSLNQRLGSLRHGDSGFVFGRPETGKTTFLASEVSFMATQAKAPILWFNNEEQGNKVMLRCYEAMLGKPLSKLGQNFTSVQTNFEEQGGSNIRIFDAATITRNEVETICKEMAPSLVVFDQLDKITGFEEDRDDLRLGAIYQWARFIAKTFAPVIGICQADGQAEGIKYLNMGHVSNAKTAKQAEADWILGIGIDSRDGHQFVRGLSLCKNKLVGDEDTDGRLRHDRWDVLINPEIARYEDFKS